MTEKRMPAFRLVYKSKDGTRYDVGVCWESDRFPGLYSVKPQRENADGTYPKMRLSEAAARCEAGDGFLDLSSPKKRTDAPRSDRREPARDDFSDDTIPF